jgi:hypothetical protein
MIDIITTGSYPLGNVWWSTSWVDTVEAIKSTWIPSSIGAGLIDAYGMPTWINNDDDLDALCNILLTWSDIGYPTKPEVS